MFFEKGALRNFAKFTEKTRASESVFNKIAGLWPATLVKKRLSYRFFAVNFAKFLRTLFLQNILVLSVLVFLYHTRVVIKNPVKHQKMACLAKIVNS